MLGLLLLDTYGGLLLSVQHALGSLLVGLDAVSGLVLPGVGAIGLDVSGLTDDGNGLVSLQLVGGGHCEQGESEDLREEGDEQHISPGYSWWSSSGWENNPCFLVGSLLTAIFIILIGLV